jgi:hypothetical protein
MELPDMRQRFAWRRFLLALAVVCVAATVFDILLNGVLLRGAYAESAQYWRPPEELHRLIPLGWLSMMATMAFFGTLLVRGGWIGLRLGCEFGLWLGLASVAGVAGMVSLVPWPFSLIAAMALQQFANSMLLGLTFGLLYRPTPDEGATGKP